MRHYRTHSDQKKEVMFILAISTGLLASVAFLLYIGLS
jgi:hypothetical protein